MADIDIAVDQLEADATEQTLRRVRQVQGRRPGMAGLLERCRSVRCGANPDSIGRLRGSQPLMERQDELIAEIKLLL